MCWMRIATLRLTFLSCPALPLAARVPAQIAPQINPYDRHANKDCAANDKPLRQVGVHNCIENTHEQSARGFDACASFKPRFNNRERTRRPGSQLDEDGV